MFQYATAYTYMPVKIYEDTGLITWEEALSLWNKYKEQVIDELEDDISKPEMVIWTGCESESDYRNDPYHINWETEVYDREFVVTTRNVIDPNKVTMGEPV